MTRRALAALVLVFAAGCGGEGSGDGGRPTVFAAASLAAVFEEIEPKARFNFAGSDELATQLREGAAADVYAAASPRYPRELAAEGVVEEPVIFATNRLVIVVPADNPARITSLADVGRPDVRVVIGGEGVPIGDYTRAVLARAGRREVLDRVVSEEKDVKGVVAKVALGEADAGFAYATDARAAGDDVRTVELPAAVQVLVEYPVAVVRTTGDREAARRFVASLRSPRGRALLRSAGFGTP